MTGTSKLAKATADAIVAALAQVPFVEVAAATAGVTSRTVRNWMQQGQADDDAGKHTLAADFFRRVVQARAAVERDLAKVIFRQAMQGGDWKASGWVLSRMAPDRWTEPQRLLYSDGKRRESTSADSEEDPNTAFIRRLREAFAKGQADRNNARNAVGSRLPDEPHDLSGANGNEPSIEAHADPNARKPAPTDKTLSFPQAPRVARDALGLPIRRKPSWRP